MADDIFCKIIAGGLEHVVYHDNKVVVLKDIHSSAPVHLLVIPKKHYTSLDDFSDGDAELLGKLLLVVQKVAREAGLKDGYRIVINTGPHGGQVVPHFHIHLLGGKDLGPKIVL